MTTGENIKKARKKAGLTQKELGEKLDVGAATVSAFEKDKTNIKHSTLEKIAKALDVNVFDLYDEPIKSIMKEEADKYARVYRVAIDPFKKAMQSLTPQDSRKITLDTYYDSLNEAGQVEAVKRVEELTYIPKYKKESNDNE